MIRIREVREGDVGDIREIFRAVYGDDYPHHAVYDELWLKKSAFNDDAAAGSTSTNPPRAWLFHEVERFDLVKMVHLATLRDLGPLALEPPVPRLANIGVIIYRNLALGVGDRLVRADHLPRNPDGPALA